MPFPVTYWFRKLFDKIQGSAKRTANRRPPRTWLQAERLEVRWVPSIVTLAVFNGSANGAGPQGSLVEDSGANLLGIAIAGGSGNGIVFELHKGSDQITTFATFN